MIVLHYTGMESAAAACEQLCSAGSGVSCHYLVDQDGGIMQMVGEEMRAWHAGASSWKGESDTNSRSIGIEIQNHGHILGYENFPLQQMTAVADLCKDIQSRHLIPACQVLAHSDVAPARKIDPGEKFDWEFLYRKGVGHWVPPVPLKTAATLREGDRGELVERLQSDLSAYGYGLAVTGEFERITSEVVSAFQRHFRPARVDGIADVSTVETLRQLLRS
jgi:N-acetylmuramoyl-L-alanine amidase